MASDFDRDNSVDRLLKGARRDLTPLTPEEAGPACLDAETLAAWADGGLDPDRVRLVLAHVADCARCQAISAAFFSADESAPASSSKVALFRTNRVMYWLPIAAGTIAATLVIWMGIHGRTLPEPTSEMSDALIKETAPPVPGGGFGGAGAQARQVPSPQVAEPQVSAKRAESTSGQRPDTATQSELRSERARQNAAAASKSGAPAKPQGQAGAPATPMARGAAPPPAPPAPVAQPMTRAIPLPPPPPVPVVTTTPTPATTPVPTQTAVTSTVGRSTSAAGVAGESVFRSAAAPQVIAEFTSLDPRASTIGGLPVVAGGVAARGGGAGAGGRGGGGGGGGGRGGAVADVAASPLVQWRILSSDVLEKSTDRVTWETITIAPPVQGLLHGSAPSPAVCWIIGRAGLVLLTTDGRQFTRVTPPTTADLVSIRALDARQATVTTNDGQTFTTSDGGKSWK